MRLTPSSAILILSNPSKTNGLVITATVKIPISLANSAITGKAPVPVPPPKPAVKKSKSASLIASIISVRLSSAANFPISGSIPVPNPLVRFFPM